MSKHELKRKKVLEILHRINNEEDSSNYILGSILAEWSYEIMDIFAQTEKGDTTMNKLTPSYIKPLHLTVMGKEYVVNFKPMTIEGQIVITPEVSSVVQPPNTESDKSIDRIDEIFAPLVDSPSLTLTTTYWNEAKQELTKLIQTLEKKARDEENSRCVEIMKDLFAENFHYRLMCGEIKDPTGKIDVHKAFVEYQELEPERMKFARYIEERMAEPSAGATAESPNNTTTRSGE